MDYSMSRTRRTRIARVCLLIFSADSFRRAIAGHVHDSTGKTN